MDDGNYGKFSFMKILAVGLVGALIGGLVVGVVGVQYINNMDSGIGQNNSTNNANSGLTESLTIEDDPPTTVEAVAELVTPAVVGITTVEMTQDIFMRQYENTGVGSGFIVTEDGYIVTNQHVVTSNPTQITVSLKDGRSLEASVVWSDENLDLAVIKIDANNLPVATLGDSDNLSVGEMAIAIGNPLGLTFERTVTSGIVSGLNRSIAISQGSIAEDLIQTDASINSGNSGGPLLDNQGTVIGINTAKVDSGEGMGFAIPINISKPIINQIINNGEFKPTLIGFSGIDRELAKYYTPNKDLELDAGILIIEVQSGGGAEAAGLQEGDIIMSIDDIEANTMLKVREIIYNKLPGDSVQIKYTRDGNIDTVNVTLGGKEQIQTLSDKLDIQE